MSRVLRTVLAPLLTLAVATPTQGGLAEGVAAYERAQFVVALREFTAEAQLGNAEAQVNLGVMYEDGAGVPRDDQQAVLWFRKAADQGNSRGQYLLGVKYARGEGIALDEQQAAFWFGKAAMQGDAYAQSAIGAMYAAGQGVAKDDHEAVYWFGRAAAQGHAGGQYGLGLMNEQGRGLPKDEQQAVRWYRLAATQGDSQAQVNLARVFSKGIGVPKDVQQAAYWNRMAAGRGYAIGQAGLAIMYFKGEGVPRDEQQAYFWALLSAAQGNEAGVAVRDIVEKWLTPQQRASAQAAARDWKPQAAARASRSPADREAVAPAERGANPDSTGSGFYIAPARVVTNHHVTEGCDRLRIDGHAEARLLSSDPRNDLALVALRSGSSDGAALRSGKLSVGEPAMVAGFPLSGLLSGFNVTTGNVSSLSGIGGDTRLVQFTAPVQTGNSGGPLLDASGKVIGVVVSKLNALKVAQFTGDVPQNVNFAINANVLASFLDANGVEYRSGPSGSAIPTQDIARRAQVFTVLVECWK